MLNTEANQRTLTALESATHLPVNLMNGFQLYHACLWLQENEADESDEYQRQVEVFGALIEATIQTVEA